MVFYNLLKSIVDKLTCNIYLCFKKGIAFDGPDGKDIMIVKKEGKVVALEDELLSCEFILFFLDFQFLLISFVLFIML